MDLCVMLREANHCLLAHGCKCPDASPIGVQKNDEVLIVPGAFSCYGLFRRFRASPGKKSQEISLGRQIALGLPVYTVDRQGSEAVREIRHGSRVGAAARIVLKIQ